MHIPPLEFLKCTETARSALTVSQQLSVLFSKLSTIYGLNKLWYCQRCEHSKKTATVIVSTSFESYPLGRQRRGHQLQPWAIHLVRVPGQGACAGAARSPRGTRHPPSRLTSHHSLIATISEAHLLSPPLRRYSPMGLSAVSTYYQVL